MPLTLDTATNDLLQAIRVSYRRAVQAHDDWVEATLELARYLKRARGNYPSNQAFNRWLTEKGNLEPPLSDNDRAGLLRIAEVDPAVAAETIKQAKTRSW